MTIDGEIITMTADLLKLKEQWPDAERYARRVGQILDERAKLIAAWPDSGTAARTIHSLNGGRWNIAHMGGVYPTREAAVLAAAGIKREEA
jgi:hypothetical protein